MPKMIDMIDMINMISGGVVVATAKSSYTSTATP
jgi:hypothetical protein